MKRIDCEDFVVGLLLGLLMGVFFTSIWFNFLIKNGRYPYGEKFYICAEIVDE
jgi:hypothetical protein